MKKCILRMVSVVGLVMAATIAEAKTKVQFWFDTEDYTSDRANDSIRDIANILTSEGVRGHFNVVGYLAKAIMDYRRYDVIEALKPHLVGTQTLYHSRHPNVTELSDGEDYDAAFRTVSMQEAEGIGMLKAVFGREDIIFSCFPGNGSSSLALEAYSDMGLTFHGGMGAINLDEMFLRKGEVWYCNMRHIIYNPCGCDLQAFFTSRNITPEQERAALDKWAKCENVITYMHPNMAIYAEFWDAVNFKRENLCEWGKWKSARELNPTDTAIYYERLRAFIRRLKADPRFEITDCEKLLAAQKPRVAITMENIPAIRKALQSDFWCISEPASWCVADCFQAAVRLLRGEERYVPGKVYGFRERPVGVTVPVTVSASELKAAANGISLVRHLPASIRVGKETIGPADFLFAALEVLETGADMVRIEPREQLGDIAGKFPMLAKFNHKGTWIYTPDFKDRHVSDRLRWQYWTMRFE